MIQLIASLTCGIEPLKSSPNVKGQPEVPVVNRSSLATGTIHCNYDEARQPTRANQ